LYYDIYQWSFPIDMVLIMSNLTLLALGKRLGVRLYRLQNYLYIILFCIMCVLTIYLSIESIPADRSDGSRHVMNIFCYVFLTLSGLCILIIIDAFRTIRWLDPRSLASEWEISARSDPASRVYCNQPLDPAQEAQRAWNAAHGVEAPAPRHMFPASLIFRWTGLK
jgi:hypothetical protein